MSTVPENYFQQLYDINVNDNTEKKGGLTYLSWAFAWAEVKKLHPDANYTIYKNPDGVIYHTDGKTCWVETGVTINSIEHIEYLPVMDSRNRPIPLENVNMFDVNKTIQRSITKACARHGLGLYIYAGEDLPESEEGEKQKPVGKKQPARSYSPQPVITAVVEPTSGEVTQEMLTACIDGYTANKSQDVKMQAAKVIKSILGNLDYKNVADPALRTQLYDHFKNATA